MSRDGERARRRLVIAGAVWVGAAVALVASAIVWVNTSVSQNGAEKLLMFGAVNVGASGSFLAAAVLRRGHARAGWTTLTMVMAVIAAATVGVLLMADPRSDLPYVSIPWVIWGTAAGLAMTLATRGKALSWQHRGVRWAAMVAIGIAGACLAWVTGLVMEYGSFPTIPFGMLQMLAMVGGPLFVAGVLTIGMTEIVASAITRRRRRGQYAVSLECPMCGVRASGPPGPRRCGGCRARLVVEVEEPRCECGYLLFRLTGDVCPECGRGVSVGVVG